MNNIRAILHLTAIAILLTSPSLAMSMIGSDRPVIYDRHETDWANVPGTGVIEGTAAYTLGDKIFGCMMKGASVSLYPQSKYADAFMEYSYANVAGGQMDIDHRRNFRGDDRSQKEFLASARHIPCTSTGEFHVEGLANGTYYVLSPFFSFALVRTYGFGAIGGMHGFVVMKRVQISNGEKTTVNICPVIDGIDISCRSS